MGELVSALSAKHFVFLSTSKISNFPPPLINKPGFLGVIHVWTNRSNFFYIGKSFKNCITLLSNRVLPYFLSSVFFFKRCNNIILHVGNIENYNLVISEMKNNI